MTGTQSPPRSLTCGWTKRVRGVAHRLRGLEVCRSKIFILERSDSLLSPNHELFVLSLSKTFSFPFFPKSWNLKIKTAQLRKV